MYFTLQYIRLRVCLKKAFCKIYISCFAKSIFQTRSKKELYFRNFKCVSISEIHLNHEI